MLTDETTAPIEVAASPLPEQAFVALRQIAPAVVAYALAKGWIDTDLAGLLAVVAGGIAPIVWAQLRTRDRSAKLVTLAQAAPDALAVVR